MRKIICILAVLTLILSMAACAKEAPAEVTVLPSTVPPETTEETTEATTEETTEETTEPAPTEPETVSAMAKAITEAGIPGAVSLSAGSFVCNDTLYRLLHRYAGSTVRVGFIHVPYLPRQAAEGVPSMALEKIIRALEAAISALDC